MAVTLSGENMSLSSDSKKYSRIGHAGKSNRMSNWDNFNRCINNIPRRGKGQARKFIDNNQQELVLYGLWQWSFDVYPVSQTSELLLQVVHILVRISSSPLLFKFDWETSFISSWIENGRLLSWTKWGILASFGWYEDRRRWYRSRWPTMEQWYSEISSESFVHHHWISFLMLLFDWLSDVNVIHRWSLTSREWLPIK